MQVKQQKKSSNKWTCVVCNQKQSVRKVFAQGSTARDVRKFVQSFNMSRQFAEQQCGAEVETLDPLPDDANNKPPSNFKRRRTDWSDYVVPEDNRHDVLEEEPEDAFGLKIVTELPKELFRKPKLSSFSRGFSAEDGEKAFKPVFHKRNLKKSTVPQDKFQRNNQPKWRDNTAQFEEDSYIDKEPRKCSPATIEVASKGRTYSSAQGNKENIQIPDSCHSTADKGTSKWSSFMILEDKNEDHAYKLPLTRQPERTKSASKWDEYITEDDGDDVHILQLKVGSEFSDQSSLWDHGAFKGTSCDERVEEDIHPDFL